MPFKIGDFGHVVEHNLLANQILSKANSADVPGIADGVVQDTVPALVTSLADPASGSTFSTALSNAIATATEGMLDAGLPDPVLFDSFTRPDTAGGTIGAPEVGPGGDWTLTGTSVGTARILGNQFVSPDAVTYAYKVLASVPEVVTSRFIFSGTSGPTFALADQTVLSIPTVNMLHIQTSKTAVSATIFEAGVLRVMTHPPTNPVALALVDGVEYEAALYLDAPSNRCRVTITRVSDGVVLGAYDYYDAAMATVAGKLVFIEPGAGVAWTQVGAYEIARETVATRLDIPGGINAPVGMDKPGLGLFDKLGIGTKTPGRDLDILQKAPSGLRITSPTLNGIVELDTTLVGGNSEVRLGKIGRTGTASAKITSTTAGAAFAIGADNIIEILAGSGAVVVKPPVSQNARMVIQSTGAGYSAAVELSANGAASSRVYQASAATDLRLATNGVDRVVISSNGNTVISGIVGFNGKAAVAIATLAPAATDLASAITLVNDIRARLIALGLVN